MNYESPTSQFRHAVCPNELMSNKGLPRHIGFIPDGNRRWIQQRELPKEAGCSFGVTPGFALYQRCKQLGVDEVPVYGFTHENTRRRSERTERFRAACVEFATDVAPRGATLLVVGDESSAQFPPELRVFRRRQGAALDRERREIDTEVAETYADAVGNTERRRLAELGAAAASNSARLTQRAYTLGEADLQSLLLVRRQSLDASRAAVKARAEALRWNCRLMIDAHLIWDFARD